MACSINPVINTTLVSGHKHVTCHSTSSIGRWTIHITLDAKQSRGRLIPIFPSLHLQTRKREHVLPKHWYPSTRIHGITVQKTIILIFSGENLQSHIMIINLFLTLNSNINQTEQTTYFHQLTFTCSFMVDIMKKAFNITKSVMEARKKYKFTAHKKVAQ
jgi:hypothetical protein